MAERAEKETAAPEPDGPRALRPEEFSSAINLISSALRPDGPCNIQQEYPLVLCKKNLQNMRVIVGGGRVISHAAVYFSILRSGSLSFKVGGVSSVATHSAHRGKGLGGKVMRDCIRVMEDACCHLSILWTQRPDFYRSCGYESAGSSYLFRLKAADLSGMEQACEVHPYLPRRLPDIVKIHGTEALRTERATKEYETYLGLPKTRTLLAVRGGDVTANAVMGKGEDLRNCVHDWGGNSQDLLCLAREFAESTKTGEIMILAPAQENEFTRLLRQKGVPSAFEYLAMIRVIDVEGLSSVIHGHMSELLGRDFHISEGEEGVRIAVGDEETRIEPGRNLARLLFGPEAPSSLLDGLSRETLSALDHALPIPLFIWGLDSV